jgi:hypothetical protein
VRAAGGQDLPGPGTSRPGPREPDLFDAVQEPASGSGSSPQFSGASLRDQGTARPSESSRQRSPRKQRPGSRAAQGNEGAELERRVARLEFAEGALARLRVPVYVDAEAGRDVLTDLDVLSIDIDSRLRLSRSSLECKSGRGQSGEGDRLLWLSGLQKLLSIERAVLVRQTITRRGQALATALGLQILDVPTLGQREAAQAWLPDRFAQVDGPACVAAEARADLQLKGLGHIPSELVAFLRHQSLLQPSHRNLTALVALRGSVDPGGVLPLPTRQILAGHALQTLALAALQDAARLDAEPPTQVRRRIELALTVGTPEDDNTLAVLGRADQLMERLVEGIHRAYINAGANRIDRPIPSLRQLVANPPAWAGRYLDLTQRMRVNPAIARQIPQTIELVCFDALLGDVAFQSPAFDHLFTAEHRSLLLACVRVLADIAGTQIADSLTPIGDLNFTRSAPSLPDRTAHSSLPSDSPEPAPGARSVQ